MDDAELVAEVFNIARRKTTWVQHMVDALYLTRGIREPHARVEHALERLTRAGHLDRWDNVGLMCYTLRAGDE